jgi:LPXTG-site transpeptidase (sortase) family protein
MLKRLLISLLLIGGLFGLSTKSAFIHDLIFDYKEQEMVSPVSQKDMNEIYIEAPNQETPKNVIGKRPVSLEIPSLNVIAPIGEVGLTNSGAMATFPEAKKVAWYKYGAVPGEEGNAILAGHRDWNGKLGSFFYLEKMKKGDLLKISYENGQTQTFVLSSLHIYPKDAVPKEVMSLDGPARVTLITCGGAFKRSKGGYQSRVVGVFKMK